MKKLIAVFAFVLLLSLPSFAQSSERLSKLINSEKITFAQASYLPALYVNLVSDEASDEESFAALQQNDYFGTDCDAASEINLAQLSSIYMKAFNLKGGLFYRLFKSPRYAFKEFKSKDFLPVEADPAMLVSGREAIDLFNSCLDAEGGEE